MGTSALNYVAIDLPEHLVAELEALGEKHGASAEEMLERALCDQRLWMPAAQAIKADAPEPLGRLMVRCPCCEPYTCRHVMVWRGKRRCACTPERLKGAA